MLFGYKAVFENKTKSYNCKTLDNVYEFEKLV